MNRRELLTSVTALAGAALVSEAIAQSGQQITHVDTEYGSPIYKGRIGTADATIVRQMRRRGAILLGKTHTTAFAHRTPAPTRNPRNLEHTPGGSSSGSAAAVAAGMVPFAIGEQTLGSVLRPASYCGVTGFKASYGLLSMEGVASDPTPDVEPAMAGGFSECTLSAYRAGVWVKNPSVSRLFAKGSDRFPGF